MKTDYYRELFRNCRSNMRSTWMHIKTLISSNQNKSRLSDYKLVVDGSELTSPEDVSHAFNSHFCTIGEKIERTLPVSHIDPLSFISTYNQSSLFLNPVTESECSDIIGALKNTKSDFNSISVKIIKEFRGLISRIFSDIINTCFSAGVFPDLYKIATAIPLFKKGEPTDPLNFRSISLLMVFSKVLEKCLDNRMKAFCLENSLLSPCQFGFQRGISTEHAINKLCEFIYDSLNKKLHTINVFVDLQKAYDTINKDVLLRKLEVYGIRGTPLKLISSFLTGRSQRVRVNGVLSTKQL